MHVTDACSVTFPVGSTFVWWGGLVARPTNVNLICSKAHALPAACELCDRRRGCTYACAIPGRVRLPTWGSASLRRAWNVYDASRPWPARSSIGRHSARKWGLGVRSFGRCSIFPLPMVAAKPMLQAPSRFAGPDRDLQHRRRGQNRRQAKMIAIQLRKPKSSHVSVRISAERHPGNNSLSYIHTQ